MSPEMIHVFWFSPLYHTRRIALALGEAMAASGIALRHHDITDPGWEGAEIAAGHLAIFAAPVYAGGIPPLAMERFGKIAGNGAPCVLLASYGNRAYDNALADLKKAALNAHMRPIAAAACVARHTIGLIFAEGRPNREDLEETRAFGQRVMQLEEPLALVAVPGESQKVRVFPLPQSVTDNCVLCGLCWSFCPAQAITPTNPGQVAKNKCICCMRCAAICPEGARKPDANFLDGIRAKLAPLCASPRKNEFFGA